MPTMHTIHTYVSSGSGTITASAGSATSGTSVTVTATPSSGYSFDKTVVFAQNSLAAIAEITDSSGVGSFTMPDSPVTVLCEFKKGSGGGGGGGGGGGSSWNLTDSYSNLQARIIKVPDIVSVFTDAQLNSEYHLKTDYEEAINRHGVIYKIVQFSDAAEPQLIKNYANEWIRRNYYDGVLSFTVKAVDLHLLGFNKDKLMVGDRINVEFKEDADPTNVNDNGLVTKTVTRRMTCLSAQYDLIKPENSSFKIGIPDISTNIKYRESVNQKISTPKSTGDDKQDPIITITETLGMLGDDTYSGVDPDYIIDSYGEA